jgi:competence protein ComEC
VAVCLIAATGAGVAGLGRAAALAAGPVDDLARRGRTATLVLVVRGDPVPRTDAEAVWQRDQVRVPAEVTVLSEASVGPAPVRTSTPVVVLAPASWARLQPGTVVATTARLRAPQRVGPVAALAVVSKTPDVRGAVPDPYAWADPPRRALRAAVEGLPAEPAGLLPSLVVGDESLLPAPLRHDLRDTGLTHLTAVSGANVAVVLGAVLGLARWVGVPLRALPLVGAGAVVGFVLLARPEPSVVRAAAMGLVAVLGLLGSGRRRGVAPLAVATTVLLLVDPWLSRSTGFTLSCLATAGIVLLATRWADRMGWAPRPLALALTVPLSAQAACTPVLVSVTEQLSISALPANLLAAPAVPAATVLGLVAALAGVVSPALAHLVATVAMLPTGWVVLVADRGAALPGTAVPWQGGAAAAVLVVLAVLGVVPLLLSSRVLAVVACVLLLVLLLRPGPLDRWPPPGWVLVACDVGQGDGLVLPAGPGRALVVDAGADPDRIDGCLDDLGVAEVPVLVVSHLHADHAAGVEGVARGRPVGQVLTTVLDEPAEQAEALGAWAAAARVPVHRARPGQRGQVGQVAWTVLWPQRLIPEGSAPNQASVVLRVDTSGGVSVLLTGDVEAAAQRALVAGQPALLDVDVLKVPHHGSPDQDPAFLTATSPALAVVSVGADNSYGHPDPGLLADLLASGAAVARTDVDGDVAVVADPARPDRLTLLRRGVRP